ncbi:MULTISPECIES: hypothetical protein [unclassified Methylobacterium]|jgi:hypothetical protein|uniref:hypothetical protein n=1 Tax=unclassified Methylobacterium TaxID=2615210 RepID=UPI0007000CEE|nr:MULTISPECIES: hypothetical protein [unclassified Methylobacterium]KQO67450.1 hypothetical protein ASF18_12510 [Methylobacterium sp. Leaf89]KQO74016.1 hypothetical protein ASF20_01485 [Methylobacterium sp. Leaf88]KQP75468.1 hypothetical protein ASF41_15510 [Methylobacterium sp. Leaf111]KQT84907.1 hypothetical protein ASG51_02250 [Methylobacterium sp. Leaf465]KQU31958.1 hypothetical protein ASG63_15795 [Methylobacterium sp. Leaf94]
MRATIFGIATLALAGFGATSASALPVPAGIAPTSGIQQVRVVERTVIRGPRCKTVVTKRRGPMGRMVVVRKRRCF